MFHPRLAAALALCMLALARAQLAPPGFECATLPNNWGQDQDQNENNNNNNNNNNDPWQALATAPSQATYQQVSSTLAPPGCWARWQGRFGGARAQQGPAWLSSA